MIQTATYVKKPLYVEAIQVSAENMEEVAKWCTSNIMDNDGSKYIKVRVNRPLNQRQTQAFIGDWILYTDLGYKVYTPKSFEANFEEVPQEGPNPDQEELSMDEIEEVRT